jgi:hypothetical protein
VSLTRRLLDLLTRLGVVSGRWPVLLPMDEPRTWPALFARRAQLATDGGWLVTLHLSLLAVVITGPCVAAWLSLRLVSA